VILRCYLQQCSSFAIGNLMHKKSCRVWRKHLPARPSLVERECVTGSNGRPRDFDDAVNFPSVPRNPRPANSSISRQYKMPTSANHVPLISLPNEPAQMIPISRATATMACSACGCMDRIVTPLSSEMVVGFSFAAVNRCGHAPRPNSQWCVNSFAGTFPPDPVQTRESSCQSP
jgi:hypothetical protein